MTDIETIAKGLTEKQKNAMLNWEFGGIDPFASGPVTGALRKKGLARPDHSFTKLGQAVRDYLKGEK